MAARTRTEHRIEDGKPIGIRTTVEKVPYEGLGQDGQPGYSLSELEKWKASAITTWVGIVMYVIWWIAHGR